MSDKPEKFIDENGLRLDGRRVDEIRPMKMEIGVLSRADGSCYLEWGKNKVLAAVYGPRELHPRRLQKADSVLIRYRYNMAAFSVEDRIRPGPSRRSIEISKVSREAFEPVVLTHLYPGAVIDVFAEVLQADAGTRTAAINAACVALADAGIPMKGLVSACAVGKVDGQLVLDLNKPEDNYGDADIPMAMTSDGEITLVQMDGDVTPEEFKKAIEMCKEGCRQIMEIQKETLRSKFTKLEDVDISDDEEVDVSSIVESALESSENDVEDEEEAEVESGDADQEDEVEDADEDLDDEPESEDDEDEDLDSVESHSDFEAVELVEDFEESFTDVDEEDATEDEDDEEKD
ncbi:MAG: exosome complex component [Methanolobus sp.]|jgi:exosome complex component RRP41|uniref:Exosome complex component Rrp41 n=1 Tax=Methanolobus tindarius DSM 2278 TaxID=1090322 RepID=W9DPP3_METTI|nr:MULTISPECIES: exosome complex exonuclease Rrp41 [Methanolobus]ETA67115.1 archaeal exosome-like complex exonuclease 1 [Methanolobus tindarius DSM 2278]MDI3485468.1 exosome complex component [Methanolobus sp.]MDK2832797.1 exosome complex component [Methanolobus sp.]